ncbi:hypothetical protein CHLNCDRAFT_25015 [Chlorella variabilis]|uniref:Carbohydrate kinase PfkB domain-containing protein n=1 Tax=Chlorella variabilis TaxID=554065 RepID=E1ZIE5_CHLVA|nr:hypothetical protein CHLNCDRAFT_25015 [Chlorella variabilis]EFN54319.1 hypothetical protein CHLNCDRAFT_25015 [Chlorella variabilis]|eukprot:XP_005846421.1 hypothetical protein CHLNCDRAFT_25015 [Chlorella variabilis]
MEPLPLAVKVVGMGSSGQDLLAQVAAFPRPDDKLRTEKFEAQGGGNCGNALTAAARLGLAPTIVSKIGGDGLGDGILAEFRRDGVDTAHMLRAPGAPSPFTYIIVDRQGGTRTCIHTPGEPMAPEELTPELAAEVLQGAAAIYFDGRLTEAALVLAAAARERGVPVLVEAERLRPGLEQLLGLADFVVSSAHFPQGWTGEQGLGDALVATFSRLPRARWLITTLGSRGSVLLERGEAAEAVGASGLEDLLPQLFEEAAATQAAQGTPQSAPACVSASGVCARVTAVQAARLPPGAVVDTTGAGDAFIGSILYGLATGMPVQRAMQLASVVAACKCTALGPRPGLPHRANLAASLLGS